MDNEVLVTELRHAIPAFRESRGPVALFMLVTDESNSPVANNLIVSTKAYDEYGTKPALVDLMNKLKSKMHEDTLRLISRLTVLKTQDPFVKAVNQAFSAKGSIINLHSCVIFGIPIENAVIFESASIPSPAAKSRNNMAKKGNKILKPKNRRNENER